MGMLPVLPRTRSYHKDTAQTHKCTGAAGPKHTDGVIISRRMSVRKDTGSRKVVRKDFCTATRQVCFFLRPEA